MKEASTFMTMTLELEPGIVANLLSQAQARGLTPEAYAQHVLSERILSTSELAAEHATLSPEDWMREYEAWAHSHDADHFPFLSDEAISRNSI
jgi:hypothetical protein